MYFNRKLCNGEALELRIFLPLQCFRQCNSKNITECKTRATNSEDRAERTTLCKRKLYYFSVAVKSVLLI